MSNERVVTGNWSWRAIESVAGSSTIRATLLSGASEVDVVEGGEPLLEGGAVLDHDAVLPALGEDRGNLALAEGVVERGVDV